MFFQAFPAAASIVNLSKKMQKLKAGRPGAASKVPPHSSAFRMVLTIARARRSLVGRS